MLTVKNDKSTRLIVNRDLTRESYLKKNRYFSFVSYCECFFLLRLLLGLQDQLRKISAYVVQEGVFNTKNEAPLSRTKMIFDFEVPDMHLLLLSQVG